MRYLLNAIYCCLLLALSPVIVYAAIHRGKYRHGLSQKLFGKVPSLEPTKQRIWFHAVSVGEVNLLAKLIARLADALPNLDVVISTTTKTGYDLAKTKYPDRIVFYCPLDFSWAVEKAFDRIQPTVFCLVELELWPNLLNEAGKRKIPVAVVNGRLSDRSFVGYRRLGRLIKGWLSNVQLVTAQSATCAERFVELGVKRARVKAAGSLKFDGAETDRNNEKTTRLKQVARIQPSDVVFIAGSTQAPEEEMALRVYRSLATNFPQLRLIIVPRHPERFDEVARLIEQQGTRFERRSQLSLDSSVTSARHLESVEAESRVLLVDSVGELGAWWGCADIGFVGGSMGSRGGQNMIEPAAYGVATCFGPNTKNFRAVVTQLLQSDAAWVVDSETSLREFVERCLTDSAARLRLGERARKLALSQRGATDKTVALLSTMFLDDVSFSPPDAKITPAAQSVFPRRKSA